MFTNLSNETVALLLVCHLILCNWVVCVWS